MFRCSHELSPSAFPGAFSLAALATQIAPASIAGEDEDGVGLGFLWGRDIQNICVNAHHAWSTDDDPAKFRVAREMMEREMRALGFLGCVLLEWASLRS